MFLNRWCKCPKHVYVGVESVGMVEYLDALGVPLNISIAMDGE